MTDPDAVRAALSPYRDGFPRHPRFPAGKVVSAADGAALDEVLPVAIADRVRAGDYRFEVAPTRSYPLHPRYVAATVAGAGRPRLDAEGDLLDHERGLPFPILEPDDPRAGLKLAWNLRYRSLGGDTESLAVDWAALDGDRVEDTQHMRTWRLRLSRRCILEPPDLPANPLDLYEVMVSEITRPPRLRGWHSVSYRYNDPRKGDDTWVYAPPRVKALRSDYRAEDGYGYHGGVFTQEWRYRGTRDLLTAGGIPLPVVRFGGRNRWYPDTPLELRRTHVLEAVARDPAHHYPRRLLYVDAEHWMPVYTVGYDAAGACFKLVYHCYGDPAHSPGNAGHVGPINLGGCAIDLRRGHATHLPNTAVRFNHPVEDHPFFQAAMAGHAPVDAAHPTHAGFKWIAIGHTAELSAVIPGRLYRSGLPDEAALDAAGIDVVVNLSGRNPSDLRRAARRHRLSVYWPIEDEGLPEEGVLRPLAQWVAALLGGTDKKVLVHCVASVNRSNLVLGCILHEHLGLGGEAVVRMLEASNQGYATLTNRVFRDYLLGLAPRPPATGDPRR